MIEVNSRILLCEDKWGVSPIPPTPFFPLIPRPTKALISLTVYTTSQPSHRCSSPNPKQLKHINVDDSKSKGMAFAATKLSSKLTNVGMAEACLMVKRQLEEAALDRFWGISGIDENPAENKEAVSDVKYQKDTHVKDIGSECPVCLSVFVDGEEVKQLSVCKHSFHASCINMWLNSHSSCPVCRASVPVKRPNNGTSTAVSSSSSRADDLHHGLPDATSLV
ncbi:hypothetical protein GH714_010789 [Hevea brasiliensis]|uniref:RING-type domain-containing protein n=1 Tax=Hevea brasiliensis TaxID=3981 RepID=A0A6A6KKY4_HEVBR|nr:hypothetical protein GH714_010789 [Hevea brasiliensis]